LLSYEENFLPKAVADAGTTSNIKLYRFDCLLVQDHVSQKSTFWKINLIHVLFLVIIKPYLKIAVKLFQVL
jgi:hypothetical protein